MNTNTFEKLFFATLACSVAAFAGKMTVRFNNSDKTTAYLTYTANLMDVYSIDFMPALSDENGDSLLFQIKARTPFKDSKGENLEELPLKAFKDLKITESASGDESMTVNVVDAGAMGGKHVFNIADIRSVDFIEMDSEEDTDDDGLSDIDEMFIYGTDPYSDDTDGDSWKDGEEVGYSLWNPKVANLPALEVKLVKTPEIYLKKSVTTQGTDTYTVTEGTTFETTHSHTIGETQSSALMNGWEVGFAGGVSGDHLYAVGHADYKGSVTETEGSSWSSTDQESLAKKYDEARATARSEGITISGAKVCLDAQITNTGAIAYSINSLRLTASAYTIKNGLSTISTQKAVTTLDPVTLTPGQSTTAQFCDDQVSLGSVEEILYNPAALFLSATAYQIKIDKNGGSGPNDFTGAYTSSFAKTASVTVDYGPYVRSNSGKKLKEYRVATNHRIKTSNVLTRERYERVSAADLLKSLNLEYVEDTITVADKKVYALKTLDGVSYAARSGDTAAWFVGITRAASPEITTLYSVYTGSFSLDTLFVDAGDFVQFIYNEDRDHDGVPASTEDLLGISDENVDSDGDGISDYQEINGWKASNAGPFYTNPARKDSDGDGINDPEDPEPLVRKMFNSADIDTLYVLDENGQKYSGITRSCSKMECDTIGYSLNTDIYSGNYSVRIKTKEPVSNVKVELDGKACSVSQENDYFVFSSKEKGCVLLPATTSRPFNNFFITITSEDGKKTQTSKLMLKSALKAPKNLVLSRNTNHDAIILNFEKNKDDRTSGYVVLRAERAANSMLKDKLSSVLKEINYAPSGNRYLNNGVTLIKVLDSNNDSYTDEVGGGSPYYSYRVLAYTKVGDTYVFSDGTNMETRAAGRITVKFKMTGHGSEYWHKGVRLDATIQAWVKENNSQVAYYYAWFYNAGSSSQGNTIVYESHSDKKKDDDSVAINSTLYTTEIGANGLSLQVKAQYDGGSYTSDAAEHTISWPYDNFVKALRNNGSITPDGKNVPRNGKEDTFNWGRKGVEYNPSDNSCDDECGDEPHGGLKFKFSYEWAD